jgi:hypothetical protein
MNVTPDSEAPIIPNATRYHGDWRLPVKKVFVSAPFEVRTEIRIITPKYTTRIKTTSAGDMTG